jgi:DDE superfamily endonuclease
MDVHASPDTLPELQGLLSRFQVRFHCPEARAALERYTTGLFTELPNKNCDTMAQAVPGTSEQRLQGFLSSMAWDEEDLNRQRVQLMLSTATLGDGVLLLDDTGFAKQGKASVGVARQYSGTLGKVGNSQVAVTRPGARTRSGAAKQGYRLRWASRPNQGLPWLCWIRHGVGEYPTTVWSPMPTTATIPTSCPD